MQVPPIDRNLLLQLAANMKNVAYKMGAKPAFTADSHKIREADCSGAVRFVLYKTTNGALELPEYSQDIREWFEAKSRLGVVHKLAKYSDVRYASGTRVFICFIQPHVNGCGDVGHVWLVTMIDGKVVTIECHSGGGFDERAWDTPVLLREASCAYELPVK